MTSKHFVHGSVPLAYVALRRDILLGAVNEVLNNKRGKVVEQ